MSDGLQTLDQTAPATASEEVEEAREQPVDPGALAEGDAPLEQQQETVADDLDEIEFNGARYKVPKPLKDGFLMQSDYTRKTQEVAAQRKALETEQASVRQQAEVSQAHLREVARVIALNDQLAELDKNDWNKLSQDDPFEANRLFQQRQLLKEQRDALLSQVQYREHQRSQEAQQSFAKRYAEANETLAKDIKGWNQDTANKLRDFAKANGATDDDIRTLAVNAPLVKLLHKAFVGDQVIASRQAAAKTAEPQTVPQPLAKVSGAGSRPAVNLHDPNVDMEAYVATRAKQIAARRR